MSTKKTISVVGSALRVIDAAPIEAPDTVSVALPSIEGTVEPIRGTGIIGEIEVPTTGFVAPLVVVITSKSHMGLETLMVPGIHKIEFVWVRDRLDTAGAKIGVVQNKVIASGYCKKYDEGGIELGSSPEVTIELTCNTYSRFSDGKPIIEIDKLNGVYKINGKDQMSDIKALLK